MDAVGDVEHVVACCEDDVRSVDSRAAGPVAERLGLQFASDLATGEDGTAWWDDGAGRSGGSWRLGGAACGD